MAFLDWLNPLAPCGMSTGAAGREAKVVAAHICPVTYSYWIVETDADVLPESMSGRTQSHDHRPH